MKVIFLDIDGVLNGEGTRARCCGYMGIDNDKAKRLADIVKATGAKVVLISTWKQTWRKTEKKYQGFLANYLDRKMKEVGVSIYDKTRDTDGKIYFSRGEGILDYLNREKVENYVILDDGQADYDSCGLTDNYVKTNFYTGALTDELAQKAIKILNG